MFKKKRKTSLSPTCHLMAVITAIYAMMIWPNWLIYLHFTHKMPIDLIDKMLVYIGTLAVGPLGAYLWAAMRGGNNSELYQDLYNQREDQNVDVDSKE